MYRTSLTIAEKHHIPRIYDILPIVSTPTDFNKPKNLLVETSNVEYDYNPYSDRGVGS